MGSLIEINDTLRISKAQGFPAGLDAERHLRGLADRRQFVGEEFAFTNKPGIRVYKVPPVRNFLVEDIDGKWLYWGLCHIVSVTHDYLEQTTSGIYRIIYLNSADEMKSAFELVDRVWANSYFEHGQ